jgi:hypothetical protein
MEFDTRNNRWGEGYPIHECYSLLEQKAFHLLSIINASSKSNALSDLKDTLVVEYECSEVSRLFRLLLECSVIIRNEIDLKSGSNIGRIYSENSCIGKLYQDIEKAIDQVEELTFREACHKIIHARHINFDLENAKSIRQYDSINNIVYLYGEFHHKEWKAELDVCKFVCVLMNLK